MATLGLIETTAGGRPYTLMTVDESVSEQGDPPKPPRRMERPVR
jgi:hypothetical protein